MLCTLHRKFELCAKKSPPVICYSKSNIRLQLCCLLWMKLMLSKLGGAWLTDFLIFQHHFPLLLEGPEPADLLLWLLGQEDVDLLAVFVAQFEGVLHTHVKVIITPVYGIPHLVAIHVDAALIVQDVPAYQILGKRGGYLLMCLCVFAGPESLLYEAPTICSPNMERPSTHMQNGRFLYKCPWCLVWLTPDFISIYIQIQSGKHTFIFSYLRRCLRIPRMSCVECLSNAPVCSS